MDITVEQVRTHLTEFVTNIVNNRISYYIDNNNNNKPDWEEAIEDAHTDIWEDYAHISN